ncbi:Beta-lactamase [Serratia fonticola AU-AP2C]|nr:Beta-lactamase [Serratia fonticola AU-AP2C]
MSIPFDVMCNNNVQHCYAVEKYGLKTKYTLVKKSTLMKWKGFMSRTGRLSVFFSAIFPLLTLTNMAEAASQPPQVTVDKLKRLENDFGGRIGVYAIDTGSNKTFGYRANERFPLCSSFKGFLAAAVLSKSQQQEGLLNQRIRYDNRVMEPHSPVTEKQITTGMTVAELSAATLQYSDNGAANLLLEKLIGGPEGMTSFMRSIGDNVFRLDRWELELNSAIPGDDRDTSTPKAVAESMQKLAFGNVLGLTERHQLMSWFKGNTTGGARIRASVPANWVVGDKTGTCGVYGTANDYAVIWPVGHAPIVLAVYTSKPDKESKHSDAVIADASRIVLESFNIDALRMATGKSIGF